MDEPASPDRLPDGRRPDGRRGALAWLFVLAIPALLVSADLLGDRGISRFHDNQTVQGPLRVEAARQWSSGSVPLWNPYKRAGAPLLADVAGALYLPNLLFLGSEASGRDRVLDLVGALHHVLAAAAAYFLLCSMQLRRPAAMLGSLVYAANGFIVFGAARWIDLQNAMVWAPLVLACVIRARATPDRRWAWSGAGALAFATQVTCGYPEYVFYTGLMLGALGLCLLAGEPARWRSTTTTVLAIGLGGAALAGPQLLPMLEAALEGARPGRVAFAEFVSLSLRPSDLVGLVVAVGPSDAWPGVSLYLANGALFVGCGALAFCAAALARPNALAGFALGITIFATILALGANSPFGAIGYHVPGLSAFRSPMKHLFELSLGVSILCAIGADRFLAGARGTRTLVVAGAIGCAALAGIAAVDRFGVELQLAGACALGSLVLAGIALRPDRRVGVIAALVVTPLLLGVNRHIALEQLRAQPVLPEVEADLVEQLRTGPTDRVLLVRNPLTRDPLVADRAVAWQIPAAHGAGPFLWKPLAEALRMSEIGTLSDPAVLDPDHPTLDRLSVRTLLSPRPETGPAPRERLLRERYRGRVTETADFLVVARPNALPFARVVDRVACDASSADRTEASVACDGSDAIRPRSSGGSAKLLHFEPGEVRVEAHVNGPERGLLVLSQPDYPGWVARVDGEVAPIVRVLDLVQGIWLEAGAHRVTVDYRPQSFRGGITLACVAAAGLGIASWRERRRPG